MAGALPLGTALRRGLLASLVASRVFYVYIKRMAFKTITIDLEAYDALRRRKRPGQSFSDVIKEQFRGSGTGRVLRAVVEEVELDSSTLEAVEELVRRRSEDRAGAPEL